MDNNELATIRAYKYLKLLELGLTRSSVIYNDLLDLLKSGHVEGSVTMADLLYNAFLELGYMEKKDVDNLDKKGAGVDKDGKPLIYKEKNNKFAEFFANHDKGDRNAKFYNGSKQNNDWCAVFVHYLLFKTLGEKAAREATYTPPGKTHGAGVQWDYEYYPFELHSFVNHKDVRAGDQVFFYTGKGLSHTGLVVANKDGYVYVIEGNTNPQIGKDAKIVPRGKSVCLKRYALDRIDLEFCRPYYKTMAVSSDILDYEKVAKKIVELYETLKKELESALTLQEAASVYNFDEEEVEKTKAQILKNKLKKLSEYIKAPVKDTAISYKEEVMATLYQMQAMLKKMQPASRKGK